jgi:hypothetical protein
LGSAEKWKAAAAVFPEYLERRPYAYITRAS